MAQPEPARPDIEGYLAVGDDASLCFGAFAFTIGAHRIWGDWSVPWLAITPETLERMCELTVSARRLLTIENLVAFEEEVRSGLPKDTVAVFTGGFPTRLEREFMQRLVAAGIDHVDHWGDLDLGGLRIFRHLSQILPVTVHPHRMDIELLDRLPTRPLTDRDRLGLEAWLEDVDAPLQDVAQALLKRGVKLEQEVWFLDEA